ncbi:hypothetical protein [cf. Phormidesmis sp. LEGE 11477]|uniref:hypothetical protein n=1 Tax=cf. Phormidesmis sp. LEGE 11477 TaxID=1828680 RepID=UPI00187FB5C1|nr:hypothetical protein [cf. Phormidesmis sp. LEGE 11477]MBE9062236.1 hypothetical protein [cf. Phormidesmis sp. LEGE 11477]
MNNFWYGYAIVRIISGVANIVINVVTRFPRASSLMVGLALLSYAVDSKTDMFVGGKQGCLAKLEAQGIPKEEYHWFTDGQVAEVCGYIPSVRVNSAWDRNRDRPVREEKLQELAACEQAYRNAGRDPKRMHRDSKAQIAILCDAVPFYLD